MKKFAGLNGYWHLVGNHMTTSGLFLRTADAGLRGNSKMNHPNTADWTAAPSSTSGPVRWRLRFCAERPPKRKSPLNADIGEVGIIMAPETDGEINPAGVKGIGELANVGTAAAVTAAIDHATGIRIRELPIRIEKLLA
jgi:hypothetical protein